MNSNDRKKMIQQGFDTVAEGYDHPSMPFFPETARRLVQHLQLNPTDHLLDVCTGTGCVALAAAGKLSEGKVTGIDLSSGMLQQAKTKAVQQGLTNTEFHQMDLEHLDLNTLNSGDTFDVATCSFGLFFLDDMTKALSNIARTVTARDGGYVGNAGKQLAVKKGGKVAITTFAGEAFSPMADVFIEQYEATGRQVPPLSWKRLATEDLVKEQFKAVGIDKVDIHHEPLGYQMTDPQMWWDIVWNAGWRALLNQMPEEEQNHFEVLHRDAITEVLGKEGVWFNTEVLIAVGEKQ